MKPLLNSTRERILTTAEQLFAEGGVATTSLRTITSLARVNLAAVNYHFGSKEALIEAVYERRLGPLNRARLRNLDELEARAQPPTVEEIVGAFVAPIVDFSARDAKEGLVFMRLLAQTYAEAAPYFSKLFAREYEGVIKRYRAALARVLPQLGAAELDWRLQFMVGAVNHTVADTVYLRLVAGDGSTNDLKGAARELVPFISAGLQARAPRNTPAHGARAQT
jgi:AcrR family transcriptional regulator